MRGAVNAFDATIRALMQQMQRQKPPNRLRSARASNSFVQHLEDKVCQFTSRTDGPRKDDTNSEHMRAQANKHFAEIHARRRVPVSCRSVVAHRSDAASAHRAFVCRRATQMSMARHQTWTQIQPRGLSIQHMTQSGIHNSQHRMHRRRYFDNGAPVQHGTRSHKLAQTSTCFALAFALMGCRQSSQYHTSWRQRI
jgi:hypothetical protein